MHLEERIKLFSELGTYIRSEPDSLKGAIIRSTTENPWFDYDSYYSALKIISEQYLDFRKLSEWAAHHDLSQVNSKRIGLILAGNVPAVGFHDMLSVIIAGHKAQIKLSERDRRVLPLLIKVAEDINKDMIGQVEFVERLDKFDAIIATGSDNSRLHFEYYFKNYPKILRGNRNGVAVLTGAEDSEQLQLMADDIFSYFGLGCRNISKVYVPAGYDFEPLVKSMEAHRYRFDHHKYRNNYDYNLAIYTLNQVLHINTGFLLMKEDSQLQSRIATLHFEYYTKIDDVIEQLVEQLDQLQCIVTDVEMSAIKTLDFGETQKPRLDDYADGVDVMSWLATI